MLLWLWLSKPVAESATRKRGPVKWRVWLPLHHFTCRTAIPFAFQTNSATVLECLIPNNQSRCNKQLRSCTSKFLNLIYSSWFVGENSALKYSVILQSSQSVLGYISFATTSKTYLTQFSINPQIKSTEEKNPPQDNYVLLHKTNSSYWWSALSNQLQKGKHTNVKNTDKIFSAYMNKQLEVYVKRQFNLIWQIL